MNQRSRPYRLQNKIKPGTPCCRPYTRHAVGTEVTSRHGGKTGRSPPFLCLRPREHRGTVQRVCMECVRTVRRAPVETCWERAFHREFSPTSGREQVWKWGVCGWKKRKRCEWMLVGNPWFCTYRMSHGDLRGGGGPKHTGDGPSHRTHTHDEHTHTHANCNSGKILSALQFSNANKGLDTLCDTDLALFFLHFCSTFHCLVKKKTERAGGKEKKMWENAATMTWLHR